MNYYSQYHRFYVAVDCIIFGVRAGKLSVLLTRRAFEPEMGKWSLMGGFANADESLDEAAARVLRQLTGLDEVYMRQVGAFGEVDRDPGERVISVAYYALLNIDEVDNSLLEEYKAVWVDITELPELGFDHPAMIDKALRALRRRMDHEPLAFNLLPPLFTLTQLQGLYEVVLGQEIDKRNFRKRVADNPCIVVTDSIDKKCSKRGARLYRFSPEIYAENPTFKI